MRRTQEWLETDGLGGFASGTASGVRTRRYHALLLCATTPPTGRFVLVNGVDVEVRTPNGTYALSTQRYAPGVDHPNGEKHLESFDAEPWPRWTFRLPDGTRIVHEVLLAHQAPVVALCWRADRACEISVRPFLSGRDYHSLHHENGAFRFDPEQLEGRLRWRPYDGVPTIEALASGEYEHRPDWWRNFLYEQEQARGLDCTEDLASPGIFRFKAGEEAVLVFAANTGESPLLACVTAAEWVRDIRTDAAERRRRAHSRLDRAADAYLVRRGRGRTIVAGYPWFTDWGRDTFIALRGLCLATGRLAEAGQILGEWAGAVSQGMLPNRFPDRGEAPEFNSVDASLWYAVAVWEFLRSGPGDTRRETLIQAVDEILSGYAQGTRYAIGLDADGLIAAGEPGVQLTWMDAKVGDWVVTPRIGKPVEVQALWLNALAIGARLSPRWERRWTDLLERGRQSFRQRFWNESAGCLYDIVDVDHHAGEVDALFRPNQIFAVGGLPLALLEGTRARAVVDAVEQKLWTPLGLRSLARGEPGYAPHYRGGVRERDGAYHQGTVWPWLIGPFVEAWVRVRGDTMAVRREARARFLAPLLRHLDEAGLGHISEVADAEPPHTPGGCPFQAWSVAEALRLDRVVLGDVKQDKERIDESHRRQTQPA